MCELIGFIYEHGNDDKSIHIVELSEEDRNTIEKILLKYEAEGSSVRGGITNEFLGICIY